MTNLYEDLRRAHCPVCKAYGTAEGLPGHVASQHPDHRWPSWQEVAPDNWRLRSASENQPAAIVCAIQDYEDCPPWWWAIKHRGSIVASGTAQSERKAKSKAWAQWLRIAGIESKR